MATETPALDDVLADRWQLSGDLEFSRGPVALDRRSSCEIRSARSQIGDLIVQVVADMEDGSEGSALYLQFREKQERYGLIGSGAVFSIDVAGGIWWWRELSGDVRLDDEPRNGGSLRIAVDVSGSVGDRQLQLQSSFRCVPGAGAHPLAKSLAWFRDAPELRD